MRNLELILANVTHQYGDDAPMARGFRYSGRGMMGDQCVAFNLESLTDMLTFGILVGKVVEQIDGDPGEELARAARTDNMGHGFVLYFPRTSWEDYDGELRSLGSEVDDTDPNDRERYCDHDWNDDNYCNKCGADGRS